MGWIKSRFFTDGSVVTDAIANDAVTPAKVSVGVAHDPGSVAQNVLRVASNVAEAETVTIGDDVYEVEVVNTDSTDDTADGSWANTTDPLYVDLNSTDYPAIGVGGTDPVIVGRLIRIENEILRVDRIYNDMVRFQRGVSGTTAASHANGEDIYIDDGTALDDADNIRVGLVATLTPAVFTDALVDDINSVGTEAVVASGPSDNEVLVLKADEAGGSAEAGASSIATTETLDGSNNAWSAATLTGGRNAGELKVARASRVPTATEVALDTMRFAFDFAPSQVFLQARVTSDGEAFAIGSNVSISGNNVLIENDGSGDFAATHTVEVLALG